MKISVPPYFCSIYKVEKDIENPWLNPLEVKCPAKKRFQQTHTWMQLPHLIIPHTVVSCTWLASRRKTDASNQVLSATSWWRLEFKTNTELMLTVLGFPYSCVMPWFNPMHPIYLFCTIPRQTKQGILLPLFIPYLVSHPTLCMIKMGLFLIIVIV